jgi:phosphoglycerate dehydrogenase-like enzyme
MRIAIIDDYQGVALEMADWSRIRAAHEVVVFREPMGSVEAAAAKLAGFEIVCIMRERTQFQGELLSKLPSLKLLVTTGMVNAAIDLAAAKQHGVLVVGTPSPGHCTSELSWGLLMCAARQIHVEHQNMRMGGWQTVVGQDLRGRTLGVLGLGRLGGQIAGIAKAFDMNVIAWSQNLTDERAREVGATRVEKPELFRRSDFISIHLKLSERTRGLVGAEELALMKPTAIIVNTSRGPIIDETALLAALHAGRIGGAALDVYDVEPLPPEHPLRTAPRTLLTPHLGYVSQDNYRVFYGGVVEDIEAWLAGSPIRICTPESRH